MFAYAKAHQPCIIFIDEVDAIGGRRLSEGSSSDREIQRTLMELLTQMDGFDKLGQVKTIMATNRPDTLDPALLRPGKIFSDLYLYMYMYMYMYIYMYIYIFIFFYIFFEFKRINFLGRLDRKIEIGLPNESSRLDILKIHSKKITKAGDINLEAVAKICDEFNGADLRNVCTEAGMFAIRNDREYVIEEDFFKAARKIKETKKLETKMDYAKV